MNNANLRRRSELARRVERVERLRALRDGVQHAVALTECVGLQREALALAGAYLTVQVRVRVHRRCLSAACSAAHKQLRRADEHNGCRVEVSKLCPPVVLQPVSPVTHSVRTYRAAARGGGRGGHGRGRARGCARGGSGGRGAGGAAAAAPRAGPQGARRATGRPASEWGWGWAGLNRMGPERGRV
jgi:hypothetical protein